MARGKQLFCVTQSYDESQGSYAQVFKKIAQEATRRGYKVTILCGSTERSSVEYTEYAEIRRFRLPKFPTLRVLFNAFFLAYHVRNHFRKQDPTGSLIVANGEAALGVLSRRYVVRAPDQPSFVFSRDISRRTSALGFLSRLGLYTQSTALFVLEKLYLRKAKGAIFSSEESRCLFAGNYNWEGNYFIPRSGVDFAEFSKSNRKHTSTTLLFVGKPSEYERKGFKDIESILPSLFSKHPRLRFIHVGGHHKWALPAQYRNRVVSYGQVPHSEMRKIYGAADLLVVCSRSEGFPNAILEAVASGCAIVASDIRGIREYLDDKTSALLYTPGDLTQLEKAIDKVIEQPQARKKLAEKARKDLANLSYDNYCDKLMTFLEKINRSQATSVNLLTRRNFLKPRRAGRS